MKLINSLWLSMFNRFSTIIFMLRTVLRISSNVCRDSNGIRGSYNKCVEVSLFSQMNLSISSNKSLKPQRKTAINYKSLCVIKMLTSETVVPNLWYVYHWCYLCFFRWSSILSFIEFN